MDLEPFLRRLIHPLSEGAELLPGARILRLAADDGLRVTVELGASEVVLELARVEDGGRFAVKTRRLLVRYRAQQGTLEPATGLALCQALATRVTETEEPALAELTREAAAARAHEDAGARVREVSVKRALVEAGGVNTRHHTLTPYVGCLVGCRFCYAQGRVLESRRLAALPDVAWGSFVDARTNLPDVLERELNDTPPLPIKFCPIVSDPYQAIERSLGVTRACLEVLARAKRTRPILVLTRTTLVERDFELIVSMKRTLVGVSLPTIDDGVRRHFEPRGASIAERLRVLRRFKDAGVETFAIVQPQLPGDVEALADALSTAVQSVSLDVLRDAYGAEADFAQPDYAASRAFEWQQERAAALERALEQRGVPRWASELPPSLSAR